jgi:hypothetical protein
MADSPDDTLIRLATASHEVELASWQEALKEGGIRFQVQREYTYSRFVPRRQPEICVLQRDIGAAKAILTKLLPRGKTADLYFGW